MSGHRTAPTLAGGRRARLERLRHLVDWLVLHAELGAQLRGELSALGVPTWMAAEDLSFRGWIEEHGDEQARELLAALDAEVDARIAALEAEEEGGEGELGPG